ncbi:bromodomain adjacent to zinc finger domain protein 1A isoform X2 [Tribolium madens]|uniref:bromodomain adjacent to zinc finger domain protein 1A isoform X2 n=1 Tax=Tribolium madens TaxID=41895 RepID=UPI001CF74ED5|nr:bromodomain adjacent to zinc finger domain protein 1A isoform X2 [Tribolium madens]
MPLLKRKPFEKAPVPEDIRDDEEVFYCGATNEIFRDYEDFSERMFLCNSMIWTCAMTGKPNLTYAEALESEENARKSLKEFPAELKIPILYLASRTKRTSFVDMVEDVFLYTKDRYFIGENVETSFTETKWKDSHVLQVIPPKSPTKNGNTDKPLATLYKYEIEHFDANDCDISEFMIVDCTQIRRKKGTYSREKCKLFLKQYVEQDTRGIFVIKPTALEAFNLEKITFDKIFDGQPPEFSPSKKFVKKTRQESLDKYLTKNTNFTKNGNNDLMERMRKKEEEFKLAKQQKKEMKNEMKQKKKEENLQLAKQLKNWNKPKEDLELVDQKKLPKASPVKLKIANEYVGDVLMVLEFVNTFSKLLHTKDFFPGGLSVDIMERALTENEVAGPLIDLIQMLLIALFHVQEEEASQYRTETETLNLKQDEISDNMNLHEATRLATIAAGWSKKYQGLPLAQLPLYSLTTSEVLRLHLLSSGAIIKLTGARWRYQQRGGYLSEDDPGLYLRLHSPHILKALKTHNVVELSIGDKLQILSCLMNQLLTYADVRDVVEERMESIRQAKVEYKAILAVEKKREQEFLTARFKLRKSAKTDEKAANELRKLETEAEHKRMENQRKMEEFQKAAYEKQVLIGQDRAFRRFFRLESVPGFFLNSEEENPGTCLSNIIEQIPHLVDATRDEILEHLKKTLNESNSSDKENSPTKNRKNGQCNGVLEQKIQLCDDLMMCSSNPETCIVHSKDRRKDLWGFYHENDQIDQLIGALNKRGVRESELQQNLVCNREEIAKLIRETPVNSLNFEMENREEFKRNNKKMKNKYEDANLGYPNDMSPTEVQHNALIENILEMEEKIFAGSLGALNIKDREKWRSDLQNKNYKEFDKSLTKQQIENSQNHEYVTSGQDLIPDIDNNENPLTQNDEIKDAIQCLAVALAQVAQAVEPKFLKKPLGCVTTGRNNSKMDENAIIKWEQSLLASTSFSQIFLHYSTLDSCVLWARSVLLTRCRICRRKNDSENMLLCDGCNLGHHLYCLKPKLKSIPPGDWFCDKCEKEKKVPEVVESPPKKRPIFRDEEIEEEESEEEELESNNEDDDTEDAEEEEEQDENDETTPKIDLCKTCGSGGELIQCENCTISYHVECAEPPLRRAPRGPWYCTKCKKNNDRKRNYDSSEEEVISKRATRRDEGRTDLPLHNSALHAVLCEVMKDANAWPFLRPVQKTEVPDYYDVITKPMDFGTIKYKLNMGEYKEDSQFMADAVLVFQNCNTYNHTEDDVYKCGVQLLRLFQKKCRELGLKLPDEMDYNDPNARPKKKIRTK